MVERYILATLVIVIAGITAFELNMWEARNGKRVHAKP